jgi:hypothetical protein
VVFDEEHSSRGYAENLCAVKDLNPLATYGICQAETDSFHRVRFKPPLSTRFKGHPAQYLSAEVAIFIHQQNPEIMAAQEIRRSQSGETAPHNYDVKGYRTHG